MATYTVKSGDTFGEIAQNYGLSIAELKAINPQKENVNAIDVGEKIMFPSHDLSFHLCNINLDLNTLQCRLSIFVSCTISAGFRSIAV